MALVLDRVLDEEDKVSELVAGRIVNIFYLFSQAENYVKEVVADRVVLKRKYFGPRDLDSTNLFRCPEGSPAYDANPPNYNVEVHQELIHAVDNPG